MNRRVKVTVELEISVPEDSVMDDNGRLDTELLKNSLSYGFALTGRRTLGVVETSNIKKLEVYGG